MLRKRKHPEFFIFLLIYFLFNLRVLLMSFMLPASYTPQVRTKG